MIILNLILAAIISEPLLAKSNKALTASELGHRLYRYRDIKRLEAGFKQSKVLKDLGVTLKSEGRLILERADQRVIWAVIKPSPVKVILSPREVRVETGEGKGAKTQALQLSERGQDNELQSLSGLVAWLNLDAEKLVGQYVVHQIDRNEFQFAPRGGAGPFVELVLKLNDLGYLSRLKINEKSGDAMTIEFAQPQVEKSS